jgi:RNA polymerase sigma factor (sigma-70 family)
MTLPANPDTSHTHQSLFLRLKQNAPAREVAWQEFFDRYAGIIAAFGRRLGVRGDDIADLIQDVMLRFFSASPDFAYDPKHGRFRGYLKVCTWRVFQRRLGNKLAVNGRSIDQVDESELAIDAVWNDIWETEELRQAMEIVRKAYSVNRDRLKTFQAFEMYVLHERPADEVAREFGISVASVHQAKSRVTKAIREAMTGLGDVMG